jgi:uncharacterized protein YdaU (DUF1376 family)
VPPRENNVSAWMPWFPRDFITASAGLSTVDALAYALLLMHLWIEHGYLPFDHAELARLARVTPIEWLATWSRLKLFFDVADGKISQRRLLYEREQALLNRQEASEKGRKGARVRWEKEQARRAAEQDAQALPEQWPSPSPSSSPSSTSTPGSGGSRARSRAPSPAPVIPFQPPTAGRPSSPPSSASSTPPSKARLANGPSSGTPSNASLGSPSLDRALGAFATAWRRRYGVEYCPTPGERAQLGRLLQALPPERAKVLPVCFDRYLADTDKFVVEKKRHSLAWFMHDNGPNKYVADPGPVRTEKEARTAAAVARFVGGGGV